jgi:PAS domain S-box-containing protein
MAGKAKKKLLLVFCLLGLVCSTLPLLVIRGHYLRSVKEQHTANATMLGKYLRETSRGDNEYFNEKRFTELGRMLVESHSVEAIYLRSKGGATLTSIEAPSFTRDANSQLVTLSLHTGGATKLFEKARSDLPTTTPWLIELYIPADDSNPTLALFDLRALLAILSLSLITAAIAARFTRKFAQPVEEFMLAAQALATGNEPSIPSSLTGTTWGPMSSTLQAVSDTLTTHQDARKHLDNILESMFDALFILDEHGTISSANTAASKIIGISVESLIGLPFNCIMEELPESLMGISFLLDLSAKKTIEATFTTKRKQNVPVQLAVSPLLTDQTRQLYGIVVVARDITARKIVEADMEKAKRAAESAAKLKGEFLATMSHEIRTPLTTVIGMSDLLQETSLTDEQREYAKSIESSSRVLLAVVNDVLDISKIEAGKLDILRERFSLHDVASHLESLFSPRAKAANITLDFSIPDAVPANLYGDSNRLSQVMINLIGNAIKFTQSGGAVVVAMEKVEQTSEQATIRFMVIDSGIGIPEDKQADIFSAFTQASPHTTANYGGTGLGLSIVAQLTSAMGGTVHVRSVEGAGTVFFFTLNFGLPTEHHIESLEDRDPTTLGFGAKKDAIASEFDFEGVQILIAEDNAVNRTMIQKLLEKRGCVVTTVNNGLEAVQATEDTKFDVILMDCQMPVMDGFEATALLRRREQDSDRQIQIVALTAYAMEGDRERCLERGMNEYLTKPIEKKALLSTIAKLAGIKEAPR